jgi:hypothetical protein
MGPPTVTVVGGEDASGFASMLAEVLAANVADYRGRAWAASRARGSVVLVASDRDIAVTLTFARGDVAITDGSSPGIPVLAGPWLTMADLCSGEVSPVRAIVRRELHVEPTRRLDTLAATGFVLSVPISYYGESRNRVKVLGAVAAMAAALALVVVAARIVRRSRRSGPGERRSRRRTIDTRRLGLRRTLPRGRPRRRP